MKEDEKYYVDKQLESWNKLYNQNHAMTMHFLLEEVPEGRSKVIDANEMVMYQMQTIDDMNAQFKSLYQEYRTLLEKTGTGMIHPSKELEKLMDEAL